MNMIFWQHLYHETSIVIHAKSLDQWLCARIKNLQEFRNGGIAVLQKTTDNVLHAGWGCNNSLQWRYIHTFCLMICIVIHIFKWWYDTVYTHQKVENNSHNFHVNSCTFPDCHWLSLLWPCEMYHITPLLQVVHHVTYCIMAKVYRHTPSVGHLYHVVQILS